MIELQKRTERTEKTEISGFLIFGLFVIYYSENYENFEMDENISVMLPSFLFVSVILHPVSVMS